MKLCKDCLHCLPNHSATNPSAYDLATCALTPWVVNPVDGTRRHKFCENERSYGVCGPAGDKFELKPAPVQFAA